MSFHDFQPCACGIRVNDLLKVKIYKNKKNREKNQWQKKKFNENNDNQVRIQGLKKIRLFLDGVEYSYNKK